MFLPLAITACGGPEGYFSLAIVAFGAFQLTVPEYDCRLGKMEFRIPDSLFKGVTVLKGWLWVTWIAVQRLCCQIRGGGGKGQGTRIIDTAGAELQKEQRPTGTGSVYKIALPECYACWLCNGRLHYLDDGELHVHLPVFCCGLDHPINVEVITVPQLSHVKGIHSRHWAP